MKFQKKILALTAVAALAAGALLAQFPGPGRSGPRFEMLTLYLDLSDQQQQDLKAIFETSMKEARPLLSQLRQGRQAVEAAVKANKPEAELKALTDAQAAIIARLGLIKAKSMAKAYTLLTPDQKEKADKLETRVKQHIRERTRRFFPNAAGPETVRP